MNYQFIFVGVRLLVLIFFGSCGVVRLLFPRGDDFLLIMHVATSRITMRYSRAWWLRAWYRRDRVGKTKEENKRNQTT